ncbi:hypothetical protein J1N35_020867 [Gossypium stocksii]|uniref:NAC domain-containing protein n=1 Tax=Gossypium stocksii TaxID=47602 RepID=A0A9D3VE49_9ROSI|nr:hypothetical protein J1N35_020867 [Gossypium stocksii]
MNYVKGFRFHPTDAEAIELLWEKLQLDRDSFVQLGDSLIPVITQLNDICKFEPAELPGRSELVSGDNVWYFFCSPRYKYRNSKRKNRVTKQGYWNPTGKSRTIVTTCDGKKITGTRQALVFYKGRVCVKNKKANKTLWVMHEFELNLNLPNQKSLILCKLKKKYGKVNVSIGEEEQSNQYLPSSKLENHCTNNGIPKEQLNSTEPVAFSEYSGIQSELVNNEQTVDEFVDSLLIKNDEFYSNHPYFVHDKQDPKNQEGFSDLTYQKLRTPNDRVWTMNEVGSSSGLVANDPSSYSNGDNNQHDTSFAEQGSSLAFENHVLVDSISMNHLKTQRRFKIISLAPMNRMSFGIQFSSLLIKLKIILKSSHARNPT